MKLSSILKILTQLSEHIAFQNGALNFFAERLDFNILELAKIKPPPPWGVWRETPVSPSSPFYLSFLPRRGGLSMKHT